MQIEERADVARKNCSVSVWVVALEELLFFFERKYELERNDKDSRRETAGEPTT
jgi:hypothetical protein